MLEDGFSPPRAKTKLKNLPFKEFTIIEPHFMRLSTVIIGLSIALCWPSLTAANKFEEPATSECIEDVGNVSELPSLPETPQVRATIAAYAPLTCQLHYDATWRNAPTVTGVTQTAHGEVKAVSSITDLEGDIIFTYSQVIDDDDHCDGGSKVTIAAIAGTDSINITDFYSSGVVVKAKVDLTNMTISIPNQIIGTHSSYGTYDICSCTWDSDDEIATVDRSTEITGTISDDGLITVNSTWGVFSTSKNRVFNVYSNIVSFHPNARMIYTYYDVDYNNTFVDTIPLYATQTDDIVTIVNFFNYGAEITAQLNGAKRATIARKRIFVGKSSEALLYGAYFYGDYTTLTAIYYPILCDVATDLRTISWGEWTIADEVYYYVAGIDCKIETDFDLTYPDAAELNVEGDGTAESPYLIKSVADWNSIVEYADVMYETYTGKYLKLACDIDFTDSIITPLGYLNNVDFCGDLNGAGYTIKGINYTTVGASDGCVVNYATNGASIHDLTVEGTMTISHSCCGGVVGYIHSGFVTNVTSNLTITATQSAAGGVVGNPYYTQISGCNFTGNMTASGAYTGGIVGQANSETIITGCTNQGQMTYSAQCQAGIVGFFDGGCEGVRVTDCHNYGTINSTGGYTGGISGYTILSTPIVSSSSDTTVTEPIISQCNNYGIINSSTNSAGGVAGWFNNGLISDCHNKGVVNSSGTFAGGVVGHLFDGSIADCSNDSLVSSSNAYPGGVVGSLRASTATRCYNNGTVQNTSTSQQYTGGVVGRAYGSIPWPTDTYVASDLYYCANRGTVVAASKNTGGVVGRLDTISSATGCYNEGVVTSSSTQIGGVIGVVYRDATVTDCYNAGTVTYTGTSSTAYAGGVACYSYRATYTGCYNVGTVEATNSTSGYLCGLIAYCYSDDSDDRIEITDCHNSADITSYYNTAGLMLYGTDLVVVNMENCYNSGTIMSTITNSSTETQSTAGLATTYFRGSTFKDCYNTGDIIGANTYCVGGLLGYQRTTSVENLTTTITGCYNAGNITANEQYTGGIVAKAGDAQATVISECYNLGNITSTSSYVGGIAGLTQSSIIDTYNTGTITGSDFVGGIAGYTTDSISTVYSTGTITAYNDHYGDIVGSTESDVTGAYCLSANSSGNSTLATSLTYAELGALELDGWINGDCYTYPRLDDSDFAKAYAAAVIPADGDSYSSITQGFSVGTPDGVTWTASTDAISFDGNTATFTETVNGTVTLTATCGDASATTELTCNVEVDGISSITGNGLEVVSEKFYNLAGAQVAEPMDDTKAIYIVVKTYNDGTVKPVKEIR